MIRPIFSKEIVLLLQTNLPTRSSVTHSAGGQDACSVLVTAAAGHYRRMQWDEEETQRPRKYHECCRDRRGHLGRGPGNLLQPRRSRRRGSAGPTHGSTRTPAVNASSIPQCKTEFGAGVATDTSKPQPKYGLGAGLGANRNGGKSAKGEPHDEIDKEASESPMSSRPAAKRISGGSQVAGSRSKPCLLILPLGLSHAHSALSPIAHPPSFLLLFLRTRPLTTAGSPRKQSLRKSSPTTTPNTPEKRGLRAGAGQSSGGGKRRKVGKLKKDAQVLVPFLKDEAECGSRSWSQKLWVGKVVASNNETTTLKFSDGEVHELSTGDCWSSHPPTEDRVEYVLPRQLTNSQMSGTFTAIKKPSTITTSNCAGLVVGIVGTKMGGIITSFGGRTIPLATLASSKMNCLHSAKSTQKALA